MSFTVLRRGLVLGAALGALALTGSASAAKLHGVVVQHNRLSHSFVLALSKGRLVSVHTHNSPALGRVVTVRAKLLRNGTYSLRGVVARHQVKRRVLIHGVVTFVNRHRSEFTVSAGGASLLVRRGRAGMAADTASSDPLPSVGDEVSVETEIDDQGNLDDQGVQQTGQDTQDIHVEGTILAIDTTASTLTISADDEDQSGQSITVDVPSTIDITQFQVGQQVELRVSVQPDGSFLVQATSEDGGSGQANNPSDQQGCEGDGPSNSCGGSGSDNGGSSGSDQGGSGSGSDSTGSDSTGSDSSGSDSTGSDSTGSGTSGSGSSGSGD